MSDSRAEYIYIYIYFFIFFYRVLDQCFSLIHRSDVYMGVPLCDALYSVVRSAVFYLFLLVADILYLYLKS